MLSFSPSHTIEACYVVTLTQAYYRSLLYCHSHPGVLSKLVILLFSPSHTIEACYVVTLIQAYYGSLYYLYTQKFHFIIYVGVSRMDRVRNEEVRRRAGIERELARVKQIREY